MGSYGRKAVSEASNANALASERSVVEWQIGRWNEDNPGHFYVYNSGQDAAHDVSLLAWDGRDRVEVTTEVLEPPPGDRHPTLGPPDDLPGDQLVLHALGLCEVVR